MLIVNSYGRDFAPYQTVSTAFRTEFAQNSQEPVEFLEIPFEAARTETADETAVIEDYGLSGDGLRTKWAYLCEN